MERSLAILLRINRYSFLFFFSLRYWIIRRWKDRKEKRTYTIEEITVSMLLPFLSLQPERFLLLARAKRRISLPLSLSLSRKRGRSVDLCRRTCLPLTVDDLSVAVYRLVMASWPFFLELGFACARQNSISRSRLYRAAEIRDILRRRNRSLMRVWWGLGVDTVP